MGAILLHDEVTPELFFPACAVKSVHLYRVSQCALIGNEQVWIVYEENQIVAAWVGAIHLDVVVELF